MTTHARLSPSASKQWLSCPGSIQLCEQIKIKDKGSKYSAEGSVAHNLGEKCLKENTNPEDWLR